MNKNKELILKEAQLVCQAWQDYGGGFLKALGKVLENILTKSDIEELVLNIHNLWQHEWDTFINHFVSKDSYEVVIGSPKPYYDTTQTLMAFVVVDEETSKAQKEANNVANSLLYSDKEIHRLIGETLYQADSKNTLKIKKLIPITWSVIVQHS